MVASKQAHCILQRETCLFLVAVGLRRGAVHSIESPHWILFVCLLYKHINKYKAARALFERALRDSLVCKDAVSKPILIPACEAPGPATPQSNRVSFRVACRR